MLSLPTFFFKIAFVILRPSHFCVNFRIALSISIPRTWDCALERFIFIHKSSLWNSVGGRAAACRAEAGGWGSSAGTAPDWDPGLTGTRPVSLGRTLLTLRQSCVRPGRPPATGDPRQGPGRAAEPQRRAPHNPARAGRGRPRGITGRRRGRAGR